MPRLGVLSKFYVNIGTFDIPIWAVLPLISDCVVNGSWDEGEASARLSRVKSSEPTMMGLEITGKLRVKGAIASGAYNTMYDAHFRDLPIDIRAMNGPDSEVGAEGYRFEAKIFTWSEDQSLGAVLYKDFSVKPCIPTALQNYAKIAKIDVPNVVTYIDIGLGNGDGV